jgi:hypothetical protein
VAKGQDDDALVHDMKRMADLTRIPHTREITDLATMFLQEFEQLRRSSVGESKHDLMADFPLGDVARDATENREAGLDGLIKVMDPCGDEIWFYQTTGEPRPPEGMKIV